MARAFSFADGPMGVRTGCGASANRHMYVLSCGRGWKGLNDGQAKVAAGSEMRRIWRLWVVVLGSSFGGSDFKFSLLGSFELCFGFFCYWNPSCDFLLYNGPFLTVFTCFLLFSRVQLTIVLRWFHFLSWRLIVTAGIHVMEQPSMGDKRIASELQSLADAATLPQILLFLVASAIFKRGAKRAGGGERVQ
ncbi:hypothetical protein J3E68DRAFT_417719 [Trichoderma sp. SZMC 28012]